MADKPLTPNEERTARWVDAHAAKVRAEVEAEVVAWLRVDASKSPPDHECWGYNEGQACCGEAFARAIEAGECRS